MEERRQRFINIVSGARNVVVKSSSNKTDVYVWIVCKERFFFYRHYCDDCHILRRSSMDFRVSPPNNSVPSRSMESYDKTRVYFNAKEKYLKFIFIIPALLCTITIFRFLIFQNNHRRWKIFMLYRQPCKTVFGEANKLFYHVFPLF